ncbi:MAG: hypothetical protein GXP62_13090 [Oligoflexia bacterium]|nr:hypothetical protein [Oligoflexia bacterium]
MPTSLLRRLLPLLFFALLMTSACLPKAGLVQAPRPMSVAVVAALEPLDKAQVVGVPDDLLVRIDSLLAARDLTAVAVPIDTWSSAFTKGRTSRFRVAHVALATDTDLVLVIETFARYDSQLSGRYRWSVRVTASLAPGDRPEDAVVRDFTVPVSLIYHHEKEAAAVGAAAPIIERQVARLLDQVLGGMSAE